MPIIDYKIKYVATPLTITAKAPMLLDIYQYSIEPPTAGDQSAGSRRRRTESANFKLIHVTSQAHRFTSRFYLKLDIASRSHLSKNMLDDTATPHTLTYQIMQCHLRPGAAHWCGKIEAKIGHYVRVTEWRRFSSDRRIVMLNFIIEYAITLPQWYLLVLRIEIFVVCWLATDYFAVSAFITDEQWIAPTPSSSSHWFWLFHSDFIHFKFDW